MDGDISVEETETDKGATAEKKSKRNNGLDKDGETESKNDSQCGG